MCHDARVIPERKRRGLATVRSGFFGLAALLALAGHVQAQGYTITDLGLVGGASAKVSALNNKGHVVASLSREHRDGSRLNRAMLLKSTWTEIATAVGQPAFGSDVNDAGDVAGWARLTLPHGKRTDRAFVVKAGKFTEVGTLGGQNSRAYGMNDRADVVGAAQNSEGAYRAFLWRDNKAEDLGTLGGRHSYAHGVNSAFDVVGVSETTNQLRHAFRWFAGKMNDLGTLGGLFSQANAVNEQGDITGIAQLTNGLMRAFLHTDGKMRDLGTLGGASSYGAALNGRRQVVGNAQTRRGENRAFIWSDNAMRDLNTLVPAQSGWFLTDAVDINEGSQILCLARGRDGLVHGLLLSPPAPVLPPGKKGK